MTKNELKNKVEEYLKENNAEFAKRLDSQNKIINPFNINDEFTIFINIENVEDDYGTCDGFCIHGFYLERDDKEIVFEFWSFDSNEHYWSSKYYQIFLGIISLLNDYKKSIIEKEGEKK